MGTRHSGEGVKKLSIEEKAAIIENKKAGMKTQEIIACTGRNVTTITHMLAASKKLADQGSLRKNRGLAGPEKLPAVS
jgi:hypothetical protein